MIGRFDCLAASALSFCLIRLHQQFDHRTVRMITPPGHRGHDACRYNLTQMPGDETPNPAASSDLGGRGASCRPISARERKFSRVP